MVGRGDVHTVLFFTRGVSLGLWDRLGMLEREVALYRGLRRHVGNVTFVSYGDGGDRLYSGRLEGISLVCNRGGLPQRLYVCNDHQVPPAAMARNGDREEQPGTGL